MAILWRVFMNRVFRLCAVGKRWVKFLQEQRKKLVPVLEDIDRKFGRQRHVQEYLKMWRKRLMLTEKELKSIIK